MSEVFREKARAEAAIEEDFAVFLLHRASTIYEHVSMEVDKLGWKFKRVSGLYWPTL